MRNFIITLGIAMGMFFFGRCAQVSDSLISKISLLVIAILLLINAGKIFKLQKNKINDEEQKVDALTVPNGSEMRAEEPKEYFDAKT